MARVEVRGVKTKDDFIRKVKEAVKSKSSNHTTQFLYLLCFIMDILEVVKRL